MSDTVILAIESSCDETAAAIVRSDSELLANVVATQIDVHKEFGGVVPEVASRIHVEQISMVIAQALSQAHMTCADVDAIAVTQGPGLIGSLHVGVQAAKTLAWAYHKPLVPVHHIAGHIYANVFVTKLRFPLLALVVSGGHTELVYMRDEWSFEILGTTQDDAIGEAGDSLAKEGQNIYPLAKPKVQGEYDFSFSGLKSSVLQFITRCERNHEPFNAADLACSYQECALQALLAPTQKALQNYQPKMMVLAGGVAANSRLRELIQTQIAPVYPHTEFIIPPLSCCTDNAAMIAVAGSVAYRHGVRGDFSLSADPGFILGEQRQG